MLLSRKSAVTIEQHLVTYDGVVECRRGPTQPMKRPAEDVPTDRPRAGEDDPDWGKRRNARCSSSGDGTEESRARRLGSLRSRPHGAVAVQAREECVRVNRFR